MPLKTRFGNSNTIGKAFKRTIYQRKSIESTGWYKDASEISESLSCMAKRCFNQSIIYFGTLRWGANKLVQNTNEISETVLMYD